MESIDLHIDTTKRRIVDRKDQLRRFCCGKGAALFAVCVSHATAGVALITTCSGSEYNLENLVARRLPRYLS